MVYGALQDWSKCVDSERKTGGNFAADCREQVHLRIPQAQLCIEAIPRHSRHSCLSQFASAALVNLPLQTYALRECMLKHREYYAPVLEEEVSLYRRVPICVLWRCCRGFASYLAGWPVCAGRLCGRQGRSGKVLMYDRRSAGHWSPDLLLTSVAMPSNRA